MSRIVDRNNVKVAVEALENLNKKRLEVGIFAPEGSELWIYAVANEFGATINVTDKMRAYLHYNGLHLKNTTTVITIPERSFIRAGFEANKDYMNDLIVQLLPSVLIGRMKVDEMYGIVGNAVVGRLHRYLVSLREPPNHPYTIKRKGSSNPLIDTGRLNQSITYRIMEN